MSRKPRILSPYTYYHVFNRGIARKSIFTSNYHYNLFLELLEITSETYNIEIHAYCLMKNHFHLLLLDINSNLSKAMQSMLSKFSRKINKDINSDGAVFKDRFKSIIVDSNRYLSHLSRYIHLNPVEAGMVSSPENYHWSSCKYYLNDHCPKFLEKDKILNCFMSQNEYQEFLNLGIDKNTKAILSSNLNTL
jgi:putative transposase